RPDRFGPRNSPDTDHIAPQNRETSPKKGEVLPRHCGTLHTTTTCANRFASIGVARAPDRISPRLAYAKPDRPARPPANYPIAKTATLLRRFPAVRYTP